MNSIKETEVLVVLNKNKNGFTLIELIAVMLLLAALALTVLPRFINFKDDAEKATVLATASSFKDALKLIRVKWILAGQPNPRGNSSISYGGAEIKLHKGYPFSVNNIDPYSEEDWFTTRRREHATTKRCDALLNTLLTNSTDNTYSKNAEELRNSTFYVFYYDFATTSGSNYVDGKYIPSEDRMGFTNACIYYLVSRLDINEPLFDDLSLVNNPHLFGFAYDPKSGEVMPFFNGFDGFDGFDGF